MQSIKLRKQNLVLAGVFVALAFVVGMMAIAAESQSVAANEFAIVKAGWSCPSKSGSCTAGSFACVEDIDNTHACEYKCQSGGTWGGANECGTNYCSGAKCDQGTIYNVAFGDAYSDPKIVFLEKIWGLR